jgi:hypothetical protein
MQVSWEIQESGTFLDMTPQKAETVRKYLNGTEKIYRNDVDWIHLA